MKRIIVLLWVLLGITFGTNSAMAAVNADTLDFLDSTDFAPAVIGTSNIGSQVVTDDKIDSVSGGKVTGSVANADNAVNAANSDTLGGLDSTAFAKNLVKEVTVSMPGEGGEYESISAALAAIAPDEANPYLVRVMPGTYTENITMKSNVHLQGSGRDITTIQAEITTNATVTFNSGTNFSISGFAIKDGGYCTVWVDNASPTIKDNRITGATQYDGVCVDGTSEPIIEHNILANNADSGVGLYGTSTSKTVIKNNEIFGNRNGINSENSSAIVKNNVIMNNSSNGVHHRWGGKLTIENNEISNNDIGLHIYDGTVTITWNKITSNAQGVTYYPSSQGYTATISSNLITDNTSFGMYVDNPGGSVSIHNNRIVNPVAPDNDIFVGNGFDPVITHNVLDTISEQAVIDAFNAKSDGTAWP